MKKNIDIRNFALGTGGVSKTDEFSEKFQTTFDPPALSSEKYIAFFWKTSEKSHI